MKNTRIDYLDGIRGWAAFAVLLSHSIMCFVAFSTPFLHYDDLRIAADISSHNYLDLFPGLVLNFLSDGHLAVLVFFILSGYVLSAAHLETGKGKLALAAVARYFRLMLPILFTCLIAYLLLKWGLMFHLNLPPTPTEPYRWFQNFYHFDASLWNAIRFSTYDVFVKFNPKTSYNAILWTMHIELLGSFLIYGYLWLFRSTEKVHWSLALAATAILLVYKPFYACFLMGYLLAEINHKYAGGDLFGIARSTFTSRHSDVFFVAIFFSAALLSTLFRDSDQLEFLYATALVFSVSQARPLKQFFTNPVSHYLGRISFPLYLIHFPILCSWSTYLYIKLPAMGVAVITANLLNIFSTVALSLLVATLLLPMEKFSVRYSKKIGTLLLSPWRKNTAQLGRVGVKPEIETTEQTNYVKFRG